MRRIEVKQSEFIDKFNELNTGDMPAKELYKTIADYFNDRDNRPDGHKITGEMVKMTLQNLDLKTKRYVNKPSLVLLPDEEATQAPVRESFNDVANGRDDYSVDGEQVSN